MEGMLKEVSKILEVVLKEVVEESLKKVLKEVLKILEVVLKEVMEEALKEI